tara:strand:- start:487 stop:696 length:210 start_codon:yes stop_codon:yes gene_type:complete
MTDKKLDTESLEIAISQTEQTIEKLKKVWFILRRFQYDLERGTKLGEYEREILQHIAKVNLIASNINEE